MIIDFKIERAKLYYLIKEKELYFLGFFDYK